MLFQLIKYLIEIDIHYKRFDRIGLEETPVPGRNLGSKTLKDHEVLALTNFIKRFNLKGGTFDFYRSTTKKR